MDAGALEAECDTGCVQAFAGGSTGEAVALMDTLLTPVVVDLRGFRTEESRVNRVEAERYAKKAEINPDKLTPHSLRHLGVQLYYRPSGGDAYKVQRFLDHAHLNTQIYMEQLESQGHEHWQEMARDLGVR